MALLDFAICRAHFRYMLTERNHIIPARMCLIAGG